MAEALKHMFDAARYRRIADDLAVVAPRFDRARFLALTLGGLDERALMGRLRQTTLACAVALPGTYAEKLAAIRALAPRLGHPFVAIFLSDFVATHGLAHFDLSLDALKFFTPFGSAEFAVRAFLERDLTRTLAVMSAWATDPDEHVRRLASEGCRPRLPWGRRLPALVRDPAPAFPILTRLAADPSLYVRKSVANHLNDISKDHPDLMLALVESWDRTHAPTAWIARHAARTLIKQGHPRALRLVGVSGVARVKVAAFSVAPAALRLGETLTLTARLTSTAKQSQRLVIDYIVRYAKASGRASAKVFKWTEVDLEPGATLTLTKRQTIRDFTTRRHHAGRHPVELQVNGRVIASAAFTLRIAAPHVPPCWSLASPSPPRTVDLMPLDAIIAEIADQADEFLAGVTDRAQARAGIAELINLDYFELAPAARKVVTEGVMAVLEAEEFFGMEFVGDPFSDDGSDHHD